VTEEDDEQSKVPHEIHDALGGYFREKHEGTLLTSFLVYAEVMDGEGERSVWIVPSDDMSLVTKMGIAAYLVENFRGMLQHDDGDD
jgi:hypothetical protein